jgi:hypothetical protein
MFMLDPTQGRRRRALARDKARRVSRQAGGFLSATARDTSNRLEGMRVRMRPALQPGDVPDDRLLARVRSAIGRAVSHPGAVHVMVEDAIVCLDGAVLAGEADALSAAVRGVEGVMAIDNRMRVCQSAGHVPGLQGAGTPRSSWRHLTRSPMVRLCAGVGGAALAFGLARAAMCRADDNGEPQFV